ncbi:hypothetical protein [Sphingopyxis sp.]|uniref:hypothetical protein n=1 Tax=Sphingopyxis sp. TaxID=1908224 RepID=UPI002B46639D|nr:hypothetical protein [Sphingopyxis sp.]HJS11648.1 hypothetical protein [Sphingopyxis sp.]
MLFRSSHALVSLTLALAFSGDAANASERGWEARDTITTLGEQGAFISYVDTEYHTAASRSFRVHYWRGPCMLYWSGKQGEGGMISMGNYKSAEYDREGRLQFLGPKEPEYLVLNPHLPDDERRQAAEALTMIFNECRGPDLN